MREPRRQEPGPSATSHWSVPARVRQHRRRRAMARSSGMRRRLLLLNLDPLAPTTVPCLGPLTVLPLPDARAMVPLGDETAEEMLATLLAGGLAIKSSRLIET